MLVLRIRIFCHTFFANSEMRPIVSRNPATGRADGGVDREVSKVVNDFWRESRPQRVEHRSDINDFLGD